MTSNCFLQYIAGYSVTILTLSNQKSRSKSKCIRIQFDWTCLTQGSVDEESTLFNNIFIEFIKVCIPSKTIRVREDANQSMISRFGEIHNKKKAVITLKQVI